MTRFLTAFLLTFFLSGCSQVWHQANTETAIHEIGKEPMLEDAEVKAMIAPYKKELDGQMQEVIAELATTLNKDLPESSMGNWVADAIHKKSEDYYGQAIDFSVSNYGGLRVPSLSAGPINVGQIFELMPFDNTLVVLTLDEATLMQLFDRMADYGGWPISNQVSYRIQNKKAVDIRIHGKPIEAGRKYTMATSNFVANGGDNCFFLVDQPKVKLGHLFRDALIAFAREETAEGRVLQAKTEGRVRVD